MRAYRRRCGSDFGSIVPLAERYVGTLAGVESRRWRSAAEWIVGTLDVNQSFVTFTRRFEELRAWPIGDEDHERELQTVERLLAKSRQLLNSMRGKATPQRRRQQALQALVRAGQEIKANVDRLP